MREGTDTCRGKQGGKTRKERQTIKCITRPITAVGKRSAVALGKFWEPAQNMYLS